MINLKGMTWDHSRGFDPMVATAKKFQIPIVALGLGEKEDDLEIFDSTSFANAFVRSN